MTSLISRRTSLERVLLWALSGSVFSLAGQEYEHARDLVARVQNDLQRAANFTRKTQKERERYYNVQRHLSEFDRELRHGKFEKDKLDSAIGDLKSVVQNNTLESHDRDALAEDLEALRTLRDTR